MKLVVEELYDSLAQDFDFDQDRVISTVRIWLYKHLSPSGDLSLTLNQSAADIATSDTLDSAYIESNTDATNLNYYHGMVRFDFTTPFVIRKGTVTLTLNASTYTFSESAFFGWVKPHENKYFTQEQSPSAGAFQSFGVEFWRYKGRL